MQRNRKPDGLSAERSAHDGEDQLRSNPQLERARAYNQAKESSGRGDLPYAMVPRNGRGQTDAAVGGGQAGHLPTGKRSPEGIPYAGLGTVEVHAEPKKDLLKPLKKKR